MSLLRTLSSRVPLNRLAARQPASLAQLCRWPAASSSSSSSPLPAFRWNSSASGNGAAPLPGDSSAAADQKPQMAIEAKLQITFTCTAPNCDKHRSTHEFSKNAYERGIVLVQCPSCHNRHLIADHLGWFNSDDLTQGGKLRTIEDLLAAKGEDVKKGHSIQVDKDSGEAAGVSGRQAQNEARVEIGQIIQS